MDSEREEKNRKMLPSVAKSIFNQENPIQVISDRRAGIFRKSKEKEKKKTILQQTGLVEIKCRTLLV